MEVVSIKIMGPTRTSELFTSRAFSILFNFNISNAALISILPDRILNNPMAKTTFSILLNIVHPNSTYFFLQIYAVVSLERTSFHNFSVTERRLPVLAALKKVKAV
jgi:hypothetical protein